MLNYFENANQVLAEISSGMQSLQTNVDQLETRVSQLESSLGVLESQNTIDPNAGLRSYAQYNLFGNQPQPKIQGRKVGMRFFGGVFSDPFLPNPRIEPRPGDGKTSYRDAVNHSLFSGVVWRGVDSAYPIFNGALTSCHFTKCLFERCTTPFDLRRDGPERGSATVNGFDSCSFKFCKPAEGYTALIHLAWPQTFVNLHMEDCEGKAIDGNLTEPGTTFIGGSTEQVGDEQSVFKFSSGTALFINFRLGYCPKPEFVFELGEDAHVILINCPLLQNRNANPHHHIKVSNRPENVHVIDPAKIIVERS